MQVFEGLATTEYWWKSSGYALSEQHLKKYCVKALSTKLFQ